MAIYAVFFECLIYACKRHFEGILKASRPSCYYFVRSLKLNFALVENMFVGQELASAFQLCRELAFLMVNRKADFNQIKEPPENRIFGW